MGSLLFFSPLIECCQQLGLGQHDEKREEKKSGQKRMKWLGKRVLHRDECPNVNNLIRVVAKL